MSASSAMPVIGDQALRVLRRLDAPQARLALTRDGVRFGVFKSGDQRRRPAPIISRALAMELAAVGCLAKVDRSVFALSDAGRAILRRADAGRCAGDHGGASTMT